MRQALVLHECVTSACAERSAHTDASYICQVFFVEEDGEFELRAQDGYCRKSTVTVVEDVSYVCSAYLPDSLRPEMASGIHSLV